MEKFSKSSSQKKFLPRKYFKLSFLLLLFSSVHFTELVASSILFAVPVIVVSKLSLLTETAISGIYSKILELLY